MDTPTTLSDLLPQRVELPPIPTDMLDPAADSRNLDVALATVPAKPAVYALLDHAGRPILLSSTANLPMALLRRCLLPSAEEFHRRRTNYRQITRWVEYRRVSSTFAANLWFLRAARLLYPDRYRKMLAWKMAWGIVVDLETEFPQLLAVSAAREPTGQWLGPFPDAVSARQAIHVLEDTFDLCRYYEVLREAPHGKPCAYKQMGKCPAPCDGSTTMAEYRRSVRMAVEFLVGSEATSDSDGMAAAAIRQTWHQAQQVQMRTAAAKLNFLAAARIKARINATASLSGEKLAHVQRLSRLKFLILQPGGTPSWIEPFFFQAGKIAVGEPVRKKQVHRVLAHWCNQINAPRPIQDGSSDDPADTVSLLCYHLLRSRDSGLYIAADEPLQAQTLADQLRDWAKINSGFTAH
ncbi:MAG: hypothetical protein HKL95_03380 [Phycisphaerae bacterium]|nr:hypothetical protein [Phycisphaerae bacterium]